MQGLTRNERKAANLVTFIKEPSLHKKGSFLLKISSVNVTKSAAFTEEIFNGITEETLNGKLNFLFSGYHWRKTFFPVMTEKTACFCKN